MQPSTRPVELQAAQSLSTSQQLIEKSHSQGLRSITQEVVQPDIRGVQPAGTRTLSGESKGAQRIQGRGPPDTSGTRVKMGYTKIKKFRGLKDGKEDPAEFLEDVEWAYEQDFNINEPEESPEKEAFISKTHRILFRQHLEGRASEWYSDLDADIKGSWIQIRERFRTSFQISIRDTQTRIFELRIKLSQLEQKDGESIAEFLERAEDLATKLPTDEINVGMATLKGMKDEDKRSRVTYDCNKEQDFSFPHIKKLIAAAYSEVGKISPFDPSYKESMQVSLTSQTTATSTEDLLRQVLINTNVAFPALLQGMRSLNTAVAGGVSIKQPGQKITQPGGNQGDQRAKPYRPREEIKCFRCEEMGHYANECPHNQQQQSYQYQPTYQPQQHLPPAITARAVMPEQYYEQQSVYDQQSGYEQQQQYGERSSSRMVFVHEPVPVMAAARPKPKAPAVTHATQVPSGITKVRGKPVTRRSPQEEEQNIYEEDGGEQELQEAMDTEVETQTQGGQPTSYAPQPLQQNWNAANINQERSVNHGPPQTRITKTGKVQELVVTKQIKAPAPIRAMVGRTADINERIMDLVFPISLREYWNASDRAIKEAAYSLQRSTPRYRIRKQPSAAVGDTVPPANAALYGQEIAPVVTARAHDDDGRSAPLMVTSWINQQCLPRTLLDGGSLIELISRKSLNKMQPMPRIRTDGNIRVSLANDSLTTLTSYVVIPVNVEGVECMVKAWIVDVHVYDLLLGVGWMRRMHFNTHYGQGLVTIAGNDGAVRRIPAQIVPIDTGLPTIEMEDEDEMTADQACQQIIDSQENAQL